MSVLAFHYFFNGIAKGKLEAPISFIPGLAEASKYGRLGVEFFFMISGYVIFFSAQNKSASEFTVARAVRLFPAFWVAVIFTSIVAQFWGGAQTSVSLPQAIANLTMVPYLFGYDYVDGVYWTLSFELRFYLLVGLILLAGWHSKLRSILLTWPFLIALAVIAGKERWPLMGVYYRYFAAGCVFAALKQQVSGAAVMSLLVCLVLCVSLSPQQAAVYSATNPTYYVPGIFAALILAQFVFFWVLNTKLGSELSLPYSQLVGGLTYPLYLIHAHVGYMLLSHFATEENKLALYAIIALLALAVSYAVHRFVEQGLADFWRSFFARVPPMMAILTRPLARLGGRKSD